MTPHDLLANFENLAEAPNGIQRLRELVLELAVRGKLVEQNLEDEPATELIKRTAILRNQQLLKERGKSGKPSAYVPGEKTPIALPDGWTWARLDELTTKVGSGKTPLGGRSVYQSEGIKFLRSQNVWDDGLRLNDVAYIDPETHASMSTTCVRAMDLLFNITGASIGRCAVAPDDFDEGNVSQHVCIVRLVDSELRHFVHLALISNLIQSDVMNVQVGISREGLSTGRFKDFLIPIPPLAEQRRIVARVDELMALLDRLEAKRQDREAARTAARDSALAALREAPTPDNVQIAWLRIQERFHELFATPEDVASLRQAILRLGLSGRLATVRPDTGVADDFLGRIRRAKSSRNHSGKSRSNNAHPDQAFDDAPFVIPSSWRWCRMADLVSMVTSGSRSWHAHYAESGASFIRSQDIKLDRLEYDNRAFVNPPEGAEGMRTRVEVGDLLLTITGGNVGKCALISSNPGEAYVSQHVALIRAVWKPMGPYLHRWLTADFAGRGLLLDTSYGAKPGLNLESIRNLLVPIPPEDEIPSILSQLNEFLAGCERLAEQLTAASNQRSAFAAAAVHHLDA
jgi:type I restriction enzyme S subunit